MSPALSNSAAPPARGRLPHFFVGHEFAVICLLQAFFDLFNLPLLDIKIGTYSLIQKVGAIAIECACQTVKSVELLRFNAES